MKRLIGTSVFIVALLSLTSLPTAAQGRDGKGSLACRDNWYSDRLVGHCEMREQTLAPNGGVVSIDGRQNGGGTVKGWDQNQILVGARGKTGEVSGGEAEAGATQGWSETGGGKRVASGPGNRQEGHE